MDVPPEPEQRTITPFWVAFGILILGIGLLGVPLVFIVGVALILITLAVWMNGRWTEIDPTPPPPDAEHRFSFIGLGTLAFIGSESVFFASLIAGGDPPAHPQLGVRRRLAAWRSRCRSSTPSSCSPAA